MPRPQLLDVIDVAYDLDLPSAAWLEAVVAEAARVYPESMGALGYRYRLDGGLPSLTSAVVGDPAFLEVPSEGHHRLDHARLYRAYTAPSHAEPTQVFHADPVTGEAPEVLRTMWARLGVSDMFGVYATRQSGDSMTIGIAMPPPRKSDLGPEGNRSLWRQWTCLAHHLEIALSVRDAVAGDGVVADFDLRGRGDFRGGAERARADLVEAGRRIEQERNALAGGEPRALMVWEEVLRGRWSIIGHRRHGGGQRFLAIENPRADVLRALTPLERRIVERAAAGEPNKIIAAELDVHVSSVANILTRALRKLGIEGRAHLAVLARVLGTREAST